MRRVPKEGFGACYAGIAPGEVQVSGPPLRVASSAVMVSVVPSASQWCRYEDALSGVACSHLPVVYSKKMEDAETTLQVTASVLLVLAA